MFDSVEDHCHHGLAYHCPLADHRSMPLPKQTAARVPGDCQPARPSLSEASAAQALRDTTSSRRKLQHP
eukprot:12420821-Alexandrium_andersonii.AAC.1